MDKIKSFFKKIGGNIKKLLGFLKRILDFIKRKYDATAEFLYQGNRGGLIACFIPGCQFMYALIATELLYNFPKILSLIVSIILSFLIVLAIRLANHIIGGKIKKSKAYFLFGWIMVLLHAIVAHQANNILPAVLITFLLTLSVDLLGRCIYIIAVRRMYKSCGAYITSLISLLLILLFAFFFHNDTFGDSRVKVYFDENPTEYGEAIEGFNDSLEEGPMKVLTLTYGPKDECDIKTETVDLSYAEVRKGLMDTVYDLLSDYDFKESPVAGKIWYPDMPKEDAKGLPVMFMVHGAHSAETPSYLGYEYLGQYLASYGYVVVSVDENIINAIDAGNNVRALLLLENVSAILKENACEGSPLYGLIDETSIAVAGHSRGGEMVATAYLFNALEAYPENGNVKMGYHFNISSVIAIAPTVDQYTPGGHAVEISDVDYLLIHGSNDQDVSMFMGEKQYNNVSFEKADEYHFKASVYIMGANHGQFNSLWGQYDMMAGMKGFLNTNNFISQDDQQTIAKAYIKTFLDASLKGDESHKGLLTGDKVYRNDLPQTVYITNYLDSSYEKLCSFDKGVDLLIGDDRAVKVNCYGMGIWKTSEDTYGNSEEEENYVLYGSWSEENEPKAVIRFPELDMNQYNLTFRIADKREDISDITKGLWYTVNLKDANGNSISVENPEYVYPSLAIQLYKLDAIFNSYEYRHQMQTVEIDRNLFSATTDFDFSRVVYLAIELDGSKDGKVIIDDVCKKKVAGN